MREPHEALVCICIPAYNAEETIADTLDSVLKQSYSNLRVLVVDNQSTDETVDVVRRFNDPRLTLHQNSVNLGGEGNFNRCIELATGKYMAIYHADDIYERDMVASQVEFMEAHERARAVFTEALLIDQDGREIGALRQPLSLAAKGALHEFPEVFKAILAHSNFLICPSVLARTETYQHEIKEWRGAKFGSSADLDVWLRMLQLGPIGILPKPLMRYRISADQGSEQVRRGVQRAPFFEVMDYYLAQESIQSYLSAADLTNYQRLERRDRVMRAANSLVAGRVDDAKEYCPEVLSAATLTAAFFTRRGFAVFVLTAYIRVMLFLRLSTVAGCSLSWMKRLIRK